MELDTKVVDQESVALLDDAKRVTISSNEAYTLAGEFLTRIKALQKKIKATFKPIKDAINESKAKALEEERKHLGPTEEAEKIIKKAMDEHHIKQRRLRAIEEEKIYQEQMRQQKLRIEAERKNQPAPVMKPVPVVRTEIPKAKGIAQKARWKYKIKNFALLPAKYRMEIPDDRKIQMDVDEFRGGCNIKGVEVWEESSIAAGSI